MAVPTTAQQAISLEEFKNALPDKMKKSVSPQLAQDVMDMISHPDLHETFRENLIGYTTVMTEGRAKLQDYVNAVKFCTYKVMGKSNIEAYSLAFPDRIADFTARNVSAKDIASYVTAYHKGKLPTAIMKQSLVPSWILNQDMYQKALNAQFELGMTATSEKVRADALDSVLKHLTPPAEAKVELDLGGTANDAIKALQETTMALVAQQRQAIQAGVATAGQMAEQGLVFSNEGDGSLV